MDMDFSIKARDNNTVYVNPFDDDVWMSIYGKDGSYRIIMTKEQAQQLVDALQSVIGTREIAE